MLCSIGPFAFHHNIVFLECGTGLYPSHYTDIKSRWSSSPGWKHFYGFKSLDRSDSAESKALLRHSFTFTKGYVVSLEIHNSWMFAVSCRLGTGGNRFKIGFDQYPEAMASTSARVDDILSKTRVMTIEKEYLTFERRNYCLTPKQARILGTGTLGHLCDASAPAATAESTRSWSDNGGSRVDRTNDLSEEFKGSGLEAKDSVSPTKTGSQCGHCQGDNGTALPRRRIRRLARLPTALRSWREFNPSSG